jgi:hypothetical protein
MMRRWRRLLEIYGLLERMKAERSRKQVEELMETNLVADWHKLPLAN